MNKNVAQRFGSLCEVLTSSIRQQLSPTTRSDERRRLRYKGARIALILLAASSAVSCTFNEPRIRPEPIATALGPTGWQLQGDKLILNDGLEFRCVEWHSWTNYPTQWLAEVFTGWHSALDECVYLTVNPETVIGRSPDQNTKADSIAHKTDTLIAVSDYNCANFLAKAFASKTGVDFGSTVTTILLSGSSAVLGLAGGVPALAPAAISAGNSAIAGGAAAFDTTFFAKQSFDIMEAGILAERQLQRAQINARICETYKELKRLPSDVKDCVIPKSENYLGYTPTRYWVMSEALSDVIEYDRTCSIEGGLRELSNAAAQQKSKADAAAGLGTPAASPSSAASAKPNDSASPAASPSPAAPAHRKAKHHPKATPNPRPTP